MILAALNIRYSVLLLLLLLLIWGQFLALTFFLVSKSSKCRNKRTSVLEEEAVFKFCRVKCKNIECLLQLGRS